MSQSNLTPGWVDEIATAVASKDEPTRAEALGVTPRRCFRSSRAQVEQARVRGNKLGSRKRPLPPLGFEEDE